VNSLAVSWKQVQRFEGKLNICRGKHKLARTCSSKISHLETKSQNQIFDPRCEIENLSEFYRQALLTLSLPRVPYCTKRATAFSKICNFLNRANFALSISCEHCLEGSSN